MPYCSILECKNNSRRTNLSNGGVSYHRFPKHPNIKEKWIDATGRVNWMPTKLSTICSEHFLEHNFLISGKGYRYPKPGVFPTLKIVKYLSQQESCSDTTEGCSKRPGDFDGSHTDVKQLKKSPVQSSPGNNDSDAQKISFVKVSVPAHSAGCIFQSENKSGASGSTNKKLESQLKFCHCKIKKQGLKIKKLQSANRRLKQKLKNLDELLTSLEKKIAVSKENLEC